MSTTTHFHGEIKKKYYVDTPSYLELRLVIPIFILNFEQVDLTIM